MGQSLIADLHMHTTESDGTVLPEDLIRQAAEKKLSIISITDHDTLTSWPSLVQLAKENGVLLIPGIEFSTVCDGVSIHILGYFVDASAARVVTLIERAQRTRQDRNVKIIDKLKSFGVDICYEEVDAMAQGEILGRPHFAKLLVEKNYTRDIPSAFREYLADYAKCYVPREEIPSQEVLAAIHEAGGISSLAHPNVYGLNSENNMEAFLQKLKNQGLDALEVYYARHTVEKTKGLLALANRLGLMALGGSDFHGTNKKDVYLGEFYGNEQVYMNIEDLLKKKEYRS